MNSMFEKQLEVTQTLLSMVEYTEKIDGCLRFEIYCELKDKNHFCLLEEWETRKDLEQYLQSHQFSVLMGTNALLHEPLKIEIHTVSLSEGIETVHKARDLKKHTYIKR